MNNNVVGLCVFIFLCLGCCVYFVFRGSAKRYSQNPVFRVEVYNENVNWYLSINEMPDVGFDIDYELFDLAFKEKNEDVVVIQNLSMRSGMFRDNMVYLFQHSHFHILLDLNKMKCFTVEEGRKKYYGDVRYVESVPVAKLDLLVQ